MIEPIASAQQATADEFYKAFAVAVLTWQIVEDRLFRLLMSIHASQDLEQVGELYYGKRTRSFGRKLGAVDKVAVSVLQGADLANWGALKDELGSASQDRNSLAHSSIVPFFHTDDSFELVLAQPTFTPKGLRESRPMFDAAECRRITLRFHALAEKVGRFTETRFAP